MKIFFKGNHSNTGMHRFVEGFTIHNNYELIVVEDIHKTNQYSGHSAIFAGFLPGDLPDNLTFTDKYYVYCSPFGQAELSGPDFYSPEIKILLQLQFMINEGLIKNAIVSSKSLSFSLNYIYMPAVKLNMEDNTYYITSREGYGFMGNNFRKHRNVANQLSAISRLKPKEKIIVKNPSHYQNYAALFNCEFISKEVDKDEDYYKAIAKHILGFQCTWSESFNYIALEYAFQGVPCIVGPAIDWYPIDELIIWNIDSSQEIFETAQNLLNDKNRYRESCEFLKDWVIDFNNEQKNMLMEVLTKLESEE